MDEYHIYIVGALIFFGALYSIHHMICSTSMAEQRQAMLWNIVRVPDAAKRVELLRALNSVPLNAHYSALFWKRNPLYLYPVSLQMFLRRQ